MKPAFPLRTKVILLAVLNLVLVGVVVTLFVWSQLEREFESFLFTVGGARILAAAESLATDLFAVPLYERDALLAEYSREYGVGFHLFLNRGEQVAGEPIVLPPEVRERLHPSGPSRKGPKRKNQPRPMRRGPPGGPGPPVPGVPPFLLVSDSAPHYWIGVRMGVPNDAGGPPLRGTLLLTSHTLFEGAFLAPWRPWLTLTALVLVTALACWLPFVRGVTNAVSQMSATTGAIAEGRFATAVSTDRRDELGQLGESINRMSDQIEALLHSQKRFLRDAAHELRSPLGRMQVAVSILERNMADSPQKARIADLREEVESMAKLTDQVLAFARTESQHQEIALGPVRIGDIARRAVKLERQGHRDIRVEVDRELKVLGQDEVLLRCFSNLIRNAVVHGGLATPITISASAKDGMAAITVADRGPGVPEECLDNLFSPFFRVEAARSRNTGGAGLGLSIVQTCVEACRGSVECKNGMPSGLEVTVRLRRA